MVLLNLVVGFVTDEETTYMLPYKRSRPNDRKIG